MQCTPRVYLPSQRESLYSSIVGKKHQAKAYKLTVFYIPCQAKQELQQTPNENGNIKTT